MFLGLVGGLAIWGWRSGGGKWVLFYIFLVGRKLIERKKRRAARLIIIIILFILGREGRMFGWLGRLGPADRSWNFKTIACLLLESHRWGRWCLG